MLIRVFIDNLSCEIFVAKSVSQNELIHARASEIDLIFKIQASEPVKEASMNDLNEEIESRMAKLKGSIELEETMLQGVNKIMSVSSESQKIAVLGQIDAANKRVRQFKGELERLQLERESYGKGAAEKRENTVSLMRRDLENQLEDEQQKRDEYSKLLSTLKKKKESEQSKQIEVEILTSDRLLAKTKEYLQILDSGDETKINELIKKSQDAKASSDSKGHVFSQRQYFKPTDCGICGESLSHTKDIGAECASNFYLCSV